MNNDFYLVKSLKIKKVTRFTPHYPISLLGTAEAAIRHSNLPPLCLEQYPPESIAEGSMGSGGRDKNFGFGPASQPAAKDWS